VKGLERHGRSEFGVCSWNVRETAPIGLMMIRLHVVSWPQA